MCLSKTDIEILNGKNEGNFVSVQFIKFLAEHVQPKHPQCEK
jgi:hypothetical protein